MVNICQLLIEEPLLDRGQHGFAFYQTLLCLHHIFQIGSNFRKIGNSLILKHLLGRDMQSGSLGTTDDLDGKNRIAA